ncbi:MAG: SDR family oxidoreductase [Candidatus Roizmanbacteria bacterium]|nr:SDR family oxidoreductase [Candidatus Roizmanbacteria bacterium]
MKRVIITGSTGLVGSRIVELLHEKVHFIPLSQSIVDITNATDVKNALTSLEYDTILHLAAYTKVDEAEHEQESAYKVNVIGTKNIFTIAYEQQKQMIYVSTDFVFDGLHPPLTESATPNPLSEYGTTKYEAEKIVEQYAMIVRISYPYKKYSLEKKDFVHKIKDHLKDGNTLRMVNDSLITPTYIDDIAYALHYLIEHFSPSLFHIVGANALSPYNAAIQIARAFGLNERLIEPTTFIDFFQNKAKRPQYSNIQSTKNTFYTMKTFEQGLASFFDKS